MNQLSVMSHIIAGDLSAKIMRTTFWWLYTEAQTDIEVTSSPFLYSGGSILKQSRHDKRRGEKSDGLIVP